MPISFNQIPSNIKVPGVYTEFDNSRSGSSGAGIRRAVIIAQKTSAGTATANTPYFITSGLFAETLSGRGSVGAEMCKSFKSANSDVLLYAVFVDDDGGATAAVKTLTVTGTATEAGTVYLYVSGKRIEIGVSSGDAAADVAAAIDAKLSEAAHTHLMYTPSVLAAVVTLTAKNAGTVGNENDVRLNHGRGESLPAGISIVIATPTPGATDPSVASAIASLAGTRYDTWMFGLNGDTIITSAESELDTRWGPTIKQWGHAFFGVVDTYANLITKGSSRNSARSTIVGVPGSPTPSFILAALVGGIHESVVARDPGRPKFRIPLPRQTDGDVLGARAPSEADRLGFSENNALLSGGISTLEENVGVVQIQRLMTTYQTNSGGAPDDSYESVTSVTTLAYIADTLEAVVLQIYPNSKLGSDAARVTPGQKLATPSGIKGVVFSQFSEWESEGLVENFAQFQEDLIVEINSSDTSAADLRMNPNLINTFAVLNVQNQFIL